MGIRLPKGAVEEERLAKWSIMTIVTLFFTALICTCTFKVYQEIQLDFKKRKHEILNKTTAPYSVDSARTDSVRIHTLFPNSKPAKPE